MYFNQEHGMTRFFGKVYSGSSVKAWMEELAHVLRSPGEKFRLKQL